MTTRRTWNARTFVLLSSLWFLCTTSSSGIAADTGAYLYEVSITNGQPKVKFELAPSTATYTLWFGSDFNRVLTQETNGVLGNGVWTGPASYLGSNLFLQVRSTPLSTNLWLAGHVLNRLAYGPTPDELERLLTTPNGWQTYIQEQLEPEKISDSEMNSNSQMTQLESKLVAASATDDEEIRSLHLLRGIYSKRQLLEVTTMFFESLFNTDHDKSKSYFERITGVQQEQRAYATDLEYRELNKWREILLRPDANFRDLLMASARSPAMIIYLDTVLNGKAEPNENYSREIMELFSMGVDNGYDQKDIEEMSKVWTGWRVERKLASDTDNPFGPPVNNPLIGGVWTLHFDPNQHTTAAKTIFRGKVVDPRFGAPYTTKTYGTNLAPGLYQLDLPPRSGNDGFQDGVDVVNHLADLPHTQEYISMRLCRYFVHEGFEFGYDFTLPNLTPEAQLVKACMAAWETPVSGKRGNIRAVLRTIFNSKLFLSQASHQHKAKTPFEFVTSSIRALRAKKSDGTYTADSDGYGLKYPMENMGMKLFDRPEPDGWPEAGFEWLSAATVGERGRFIQHLLMAANAPTKHDYPNRDGATTVKNVSNPVELLKLKLPLPALQSDASVVTDYFLGLLYPGEGAANLASDRALAIEFLNSDATGIPNSSPFKNLSTTTKPYDDRVRGLVAFLMCSPRFSEQ